MVAKLDVLGPFQVLKRPLTLPLRETKPAAEGSERAGPLAWWKLDETEGTTATDAAGNRIEGRIQGSPHWAVQGTQGGALEFDGARNWVECDSESLDLSERLTVSAWFKTRNFDQPSQTILAKGDAWRIQRSGEKGHLEFALTGPQTTGASRGRPPTVASKRAVDDGQWHHVVGLYDGKRIALYLDGEEQGAITASGSIVVNNLPVTLGENSASRGRCFNGWLDDTRIYGRGLSAEEIATLRSENRK